MAKTNGICWYTTAPSVEDFADLRAQVGWGETDLSLAQISLDNSLLHLTAYQDERLIGMVRVIGDGALFFYIQDLIIVPDMQGTGLGKMLMMNLSSGLVKWLNQVQLLAYLALVAKKAFIANLVMLSEQVSH